MSVQALKNMNHGIKEGQESILFTLFTNRIWFEGFNASPLHYLFMPILGLTFFINAALDWYQFKKAVNKNLELLWLAVASTLSATGAMTAITGTLIGHAIGFSFLAGPYFFIAAVGIGLLTQSALFFLNGYRAYLAPKHSEYRSHHLQAMISNALTMLTLAAIVASVVVVLIVPGGPAISAAIAGTAVALTLINLGWRALPQDTKDWFKVILGFAKPTEMISVAPVASLGERETIKAQASSQLFAQGYRKHHVRVLLETEGKEAAKAYLVKSIQLQQQKHRHVTPGSKIDSKMKVLEIFSEVLKQNNNLPNKSALNLKYPQAFQSHFRYKGDVEDLYEAVALMTQYLEPKATINVNPGHS